MKFRNEIRLHSGESVAPFVGAWIEILTDVDTIKLIGSLRSSERGLKSMEQDLSEGEKESLRSSERGLKYWGDDVVLRWATVAPFVGAWIEIDALEENAQDLEVAPFVGAWIEICIFYTFYTIYTVAPFVGAWIEIYGRIKHIHGFAVAPFVGAWIEITIADVS